MFKIVNYFEIPILGFPPPKRLYITDHGKGLFLNRSKRQRERFFRWAELDDDTSQNDFQHDQVFWSEKILEREKER